MPVALITGASRGLGLATARRLVDLGWEVVLDARNGAGLAQALDALHAGSSGHAIAGDVADPTHRAELVATVQALGRLDLLLNNASVLGPSPQPDLAQYPLEELAHVYAVNAIAPLALVQPLLGLLETSGGVVVNVTSDAAVEAYEGWGGYGSSKAALDQLTAVLATERPNLRVYAFDPGDMRTQMHQEAFPGQDISDRPEPATVVPALLRLVSERPPSGRYRAAELDVAVTA